MVHVSQNVINLERKKAFKKILEWKKGCERTKSNFKQKYFFQTNRENNTTDIFLLLQRSRAVPRFLNRHCTHCRSLKR